MRSKPKRTHKSIRTLIVKVTVLLTMLLSITFSVSCFFLFQRYARASVLRANEFNLQLVANLVSQDLVELNSLSNLASHDSNVSAFLQSKAPSKQAMLEVYDTLLQRILNNKAQSYLQRLVVTDGSTKLVQSGGAVSSVTHNVPLTIYNLQLLPGISQARESVLEAVVEDPFVPEKYANSLLIVRPVYASQGQHQIGTIYLLASTRLISDRLKSYDISDGSLLYLTTPTGSWRINGETFSKETLDYTVLDIDNSTMRNQNTIIETIYNPMQGKMTSVSCPIGSTGLYLTHCIPQNQLFAGQGVLWGMITIMSLAVVLCGVLLSRYLGKVIMQPIGQLSKRMDAIAGGDFSFDPTIEFENEFGTVGKGINKLSHDVSSLMKKRVADEQEKQQLEYKMLQNQINPHFIYNTLNSIKWMATIQGAAGIAEITTAFSHLLKSVAKNNRPLITLREEFVLLNDYCTIQQYRYGGNITIEIADISDENLCNGLIPSFSLQPLAENAIFHGIEPKGGVGSIWLRIYQDSNGDIHIQMEDDGIGMSQETIASIFNGNEKKDTQKYEQIGILNVHRRIQFAFGEQYGLTLHSELGKFTRVELLIPFITAPPPSSI